MIFIGTIMLLKQFFFGPSEQHAFHAMTVILFDPETSGHQFDLAAAEPGHPDVLVRFLSECRKHFSTLLP